MAKAELQTFLTALSESPALRERFKSDPDGVMAEYDLSDEERELVSSGDTAAMSRYLGDAAAGVMVRVDYD